MRFESTLKAYMFARDACINALHETPAVSGNCPQTDALPHDISILVPLRCSELAPLTTMYSQLLAY